LDSLPLAKSVLSLQVNDRLTIRLTIRKNGGKREGIFGTIFIFLVMSKDLVFVYLGFHRSPHSMCVQWFCSQTEIPCGHCNTKGKQLWEHEWSAENVCVNLQMEMKLTKCLIFFFFVQIVQSSVCSTKVV